MKLEELKEAITELMNERWDEDPTQKALDDWEDEQAIKDTWFDSESSQATEQERQLLKRMATLAYKGKYKNVSFDDALSGAMSSIGFNPDDLQLRERDVADYICRVVTAGADGHWLKLGVGKPENCPAHWGASAARSKPSSGGGGGGMDSAAARDWLRKLERNPRAKAMWDAIKQIYDDERARGKTVSFRDAVRQAERKTGGSGAAYIRADMAKAEAVAKLVFLAEAKKKRGFGEGDPPEEEIYKKREVVQEIDAESEEAAKNLSDTSTKQGEASQGVADAHTRGAEAAKQRQNASKAWKDAKTTQIKAVDAAERAASEEAKATDAQASALDAAQKAADAIEKAQTEKEKYLGIAKQAAEQEKEAATAAEEAAKAEEEAEKEISDATKNQADQLEKGAEDEKAFGDAIASDEEARAKEEEAAEKEKEAAEKEKEEAARKAKEEDRKAADKEAAADAEENQPEKEEEEEEPESMTEMIKTMVREVISERKWGEDKPAEAATPQQKLAKSGLTADDLRGMVLNTVMRGQEEREAEMIKILNKMLDSLQSIEYHSTPAKGAASKHAQQSAAAWLNEGSNKQIFRSVPSLISEMRDNGMDMLADDNESFFKWALANSDLTMQEIKNEADAQIADLKKMLRKMSDHVTGKEDSLEKQKLRGEVPGHH
tara:strand:+ start:4945 stop:6930 length:1986 start_codon:yes stop_codon:yes gene_type:complete